MKGKRILVVDDDAIVLNSCRRVLEADRFEVTLARNAGEAIEKLESSGIFDMMIMDVKMPEADGVYLLEKISERWPLDRYPQLPVLVMTGYPTPETMRDLIDRGAREFISKPFTPDELLEATYRVLKVDRGNEG
jgi:DNA-binding NtrC family response regulator